MALLQQEALAALAAAIHLCNRVAGSAVSHAILAEVSDEAKEPAIPRTQSMPVQPTTQPDRLVKTTSMHLQPVFRGRWADLESEDEA